MYKITTVVPTNEIWRFNELGDLIPVEDGTTTVITTAKEGDVAIKLVGDFCKMIVADEVKSLTITKCNDNHRQTEV